MDQRDFTACQNISVMQWNEGGWQPTTKVSLEELYTEGPGQVPKIIWPDTKVYIIIARTPADLEKAKHQHIYRKEFTSCFFMPEVWQSDHLNNANGYFGCEATRDAGNVTGFNTWSFFEMKHLPKKLEDYYWTKLNVSTRWLRSTNQMGILLLDPSKDISLPLLNPDPRKLNDPFWVYSDLLQEVARLQEIAVWKIRDHVRDIEKEAEKEEKEKQEKEKEKEKEHENRSLGKRPEPKYRPLHDIARHAIHVTESLDVAVQNVNHIIRQHEMYIHARRNQYAPQTPQDTPFEDISSRLSFFQSHIESIRHRSISNQKRLQNEIQLKFNEVAQYDAGVTVQISHAARLDSATMKTLAFVTLTFLPPTFISAIFSMSFFNYDRDKGWAVSDKFWIYWVFAVPTTILTGLIWQYWSRLFPRHSHSQVEKPKEMPEKELEKVPNELPMYSV
ncbi:uncharacterized protein N7484_010828 [Penicillium longicatenatum]|uniref:uncharacterized protein n=1 Tax=Penicillium longicatenatum TaxID=1561947 RepID=UPI00254909EE|nr:uncharacterized protein N7484_010828 [Penicillium longicatenatum]KAJ5630728.1 hypothetical protein N7484_010828 [Penicillium longicatenatum]